MDELKNLTETELAKQLSASLTRLADSKEKSEIEQLTHDLQTHQIELEMQNRELREAQHKLEESRNSYVDLYDFAPVSYLSLDERGIIREINLTGATMLGLERARIIGKPFSSFLERGEQSKFFKHIKTAFQSKDNVIDEVQLHQKGNSSVTAQIESRCFDIDLDESRLCRIIVTDISERKRWENELLNAKDESESANRAKTQFLSSMSHELRTPLNAILGFSQLLEMNEKDEQKRKNILEVIEAGNHLLKLITQVLDLAKIESGNVELSIKNYSLNKILNECLSMIKPFTDKHEIQIDENVSSFPDTNISVDEMRFKQVILNLLSNAIKYNSEKGKVTINCSSNDKNMLCLSITDVGKGFTPEQLTHLFEPFERFGAANSHIEGTGLGLVIAKDLIVSMGGTITVESEIRKGSRFIIEVPLS